MEATSVPIRKSKGMTHDENLGPRTINKGAAPMVGAAISKVTAPEYQYQSEPTADLSTVRLSRLESPTPITWDEVLRRIAAGEDVQAAIDQYNRQVKDQPKPAPKDEPHAG